MSTKAYIESGNLEAHALGALTKSESGDVLSIAQKYPEVAKEMVAVERVVEELMLRLAVAPPPSVKNRIWDEWSKDVSLFN